MRIKTMQQIDQLEEEHCKTCEKLTNINAYSSDRLHYCNTKCNIGQGLKALGNKLLGASDDKVKEILKKGQAMTTKEVEFLLDKRVARKEIQLALGISSITAGETFRNIERAKEMKSNQDVVQGLTKKGYSPKQIHEKTKIPLSSIYTYRSLNKAEEKAVGETRKDSVPKSEPVKGVVEMATVENTEKNVELEKKVVVLEEENKQLKDELEQIQQRFNRREESYEELAEKYHKEKQKHELLFTYLWLDKGDTTGL